MNRTLHPASTHTAILHLLLGACLITMIACGRSRAAPEGLRSPWREHDTPDDIALLADDLLAFRAIHDGRLPDSLARLDASGLSSGGPYAERAFAYHPDGIGILGDGWRLMLVDDRVRERDHAWCIVRPPVRIGRSPRLRVVLVPLTELRIAAANATMQ